MRCVVACRHVSPVERHEGDDVVGGADHTVPERLQPRQHEPCHAQATLQQGVGTGAGAGAGMS